MHRLKEKRKDILYRWETATGYLFGFLFVLSFLVGQSLREGNELDGRTWIILFGSAILSDLVVGTGVNFLLKGIKKFFSVKGQKSKWTNRQLFLWNYVGFLGFQVPVFLAYYPGLFAYDVAYQIPQKIGSYTTWQPLAHTLLLQLFYSLGGLIGNRTLGMAFYTVFQMCIFDAALAYFMLYMHRKRIRKSICYIIFFMMALLPIYSVLVISMTKDVLFSASFLVLFLSLIYFEEDTDNMEKTECYILFILSLTGVCVFRNNGIYAVAVMALIGCIHYKKEERKRFFRVALIGLLCAFIVTEAMLWGTQAKKGSANELMSVPYQQVARVYITESDQLTEVEKKWIKSMFPTVQNYNPYVSDAVKNSSNAIDRKKWFAKVYFQLLVKYPQRYVEAFLLNTMGYWYILDTSSAEIYGYGSAIRQGYFLTDTKEGFDIVHTSYFPALEDLYQYLFCENHYQEIPLGALLFSLAFYFWLILLGTIYAWQHNMKQAVTPLALLLPFLLTLYAGPCALVRYAFPYILCVPPLYILVFHEDTVCQKRE